MTEYPPELELVACVVAGRLTALGQRHGDVYSYCLHQNCEGVLAAVQRLVETALVGAEDSVLTLAVIPDEVPGDSGLCFSAHVLCTLPIHGIETGTLLQWPEDEALMLGLEPFAFRYNRTPVLPSLSSSPDELQADRSPVQLQSHDASDSDGDIPDL